MRASVSNAPLEAEVQGHLHSMHEPEVQRVLLSYTCRLHTLIG